MCSKISNLTVTGIIPETEVLSHSMCTIGLIFICSTLGILFLNNFLFSFYSLISFLNKKIWNLGTLQNKGITFLEQNFFWRNSIPEQWLDEVFLKGLPPTHRLSFLPDLSRSQRGQKFVKNGRKSAHGRTRTMPAARRGLQRTGQRQDTGPGTYRGASNLRS